MGRSSGFVKYVVVPILVGAFGFFAVGPYLAKSPKMQKMVDQAKQFVPAGKASAPSAPESPGTTASEGNAPVSGEPHSSVDVRPLPDGDGTDPPVETHRRRRRR